MQGKDPALWPHFVPLTRIFRSFPKQQQCRHLILTFPRGAHAHTWGCLPPPLRTYQHLLYNLLSVFEKLQVFFTLAWPEIFFYTQVKDLVLSELRSLEDEGKSFGCCRKLSGMMSPSPHRLTELGWLANTRRLRKISISYFNTPNSWWISYFNPTNLW